MKGRKVFLACDHGGFDLKQDLRGFLETQGAVVADFGTHGKDAVDFPDFAFLVAQAVAGNRAAGGDACGIMIDTIGQASAMVCNKVPGIRAVVGFHAWGIQSAREHSDANLLCLGGGVLGPGLARDLVRLFLTTAYAGGRHQARLDKLLAYERQALCSGSGR